MAVKLRRPRLLRAMVVLMVAIGGCAPGPLPPRSTECTLAMLITRGIVGCEPARSMPDALDEEGKRFSPAPGKANLYVVRPSIRGGRYLWSIEIDGKAAGRIAEHTYLLLEVDPGTYQVTAITAENQHSIFVNANRDESAYVEVVSRMGWAEARAELRALPPEEGKTAVRSARRADSLLALRPAPVAASGAGTSTTYFNPAYRWSITYPGGWRLDDRESRSVKLSKGRTLVGIYTGTAVPGLSLDQMADDNLRAWEHHVGNVFTQISRRNVTLPNGLEAVEVVHHIGRGAIGKSRKIIAVVKDRGFWIDAEAFLDDWPLFEPELDGIIASFTVRE